VFFPLRHGRPYFRNTVAATEWLGLWQLDLGRSADSLQFHGGSGVGKRTGCIIENPAMAAAVFLRCAGALRRILWLHVVFGLPVVGDLMRPCVANAVELSAYAAGLRFVVSFLILLCRRQRWV
jgi:hypothetical protein